MNWKDHQQQNDKGQGVQKHSSDGSVNEKWLEIHRPNEAEKNKDVGKGGGWNPAGKGTTSPKK